MHVPREVYAQVMVFTCEQLEFSYIMGAHIRPHILTLCDIEPQQIP